jgi:hypothetical protein
MTFQNIRLALRSLVHDRSVSAIAILCLALGIGVNATLFSIIARHSEVAGQKSCSGKLVLASSEWSATRRMVSALKSPSSQLDGRRPIRISAITTGSECLAGRVTASAA